MPIQINWKDIILLFGLIIISIFSFTMKINIQYYVMIGTFIFICYLLYKHGLKNLTILFK